MPESTQQVATVYGCPSCMTIYELDEQHFKVEVIDHEGDIVDRMCTDCGERGFVPETGNWDLERLSFAEQGRLVEAAAVAHNIMLNEGAECSCGLLFKCHLCELSELVLKARVEA